MKKTFADLEFKEHPIAIEARMLKSKFGIDTYEVMELSDTKLGLEPQGYLTIDELNQFMSDLQELPNENKITYLSAGGIKMISKELLSEVLNTKIQAFRYVSDKDRKYRKEVFIICDDEGSYDLSPVELANKCKEWASKQYYEFRISIRHYGTRFNIDISSRNRTINGFYAETENEAIFKACEWILKEISK